MYHRNHPFFRALFCIAATSLFAASLHAQTQALPYSFRTDVAVELVTHALPATPARLDPVPQRAEDGTFFLPSAEPSIEHALKLGLADAGRWTDLPDGGRLWQLRIEVPGAEALQLRYDAFALPAGGQLYLYDDQRSHVLGAFTAADNPRHGFFATDAVPGAATILEYYEPAGVSAAAHLELAAVVARWSTGGTHATQGPYVPRALPCSINVACPAGQGWENESNAVVKISNGCTGVLVNNTNEDGKPYVLTVAHCNYPSVGDTLNWSFRFNYQSDTCADPAQTPSFDSVSGAVVRATAAAPADFALLELLEPIPASYNVNYAGWSIADHTPANGVVIGHPVRDIKKITVDDQPIADDYDNPNYWLADFDHGTVEGGSSGSPLFNDGHELIGVLRAARYVSSTCNGFEGDDNRALITFPKLSYIWNVGNPGERLSDFLDPAGTGSENLPPLGPPSPVWINEVNAHGSNPQTDEFIEIVGPPGTDLTGYQIDVYSCSGGSAVLQSTQTIDPFVLQNDYEQFGIFLLAGSAANVPNTDQEFSGSGNNLLPDGSGVLTLKNDAGQSIFTYQYDALAGGTPLNCPVTTITRSDGDLAGDGTMGFTISAQPTSSDLASTGLTASPGEQNWDGGQVLPVELVAFDAVLDGEAVLLRWETASETNNAGFEVQRLAPAGTQPEGDWEALSWVDGHGTTLEPQAYTLRLDALQAGTYRFRLKQIDFDGTFEYSPEVEVAIGLPTTYRLSNAFPNPFNPETQFSLAVAQTQHVDVGVYNLLGQRVTTLFDGMLDGQSTRAFTFEATDLPSGLYLIRAVGERFATSQTVTLLK